MKAKPGFKKTACTGVVHTLTHNFSEQIYGQSGCYAERGVLYSTGVSQQARVNKGGFVMSPNGPAVATAPSAALFKLLHLQQSHRPKAEQSSGRTAPRHDGRREHLAAGLQHRRLHAKACGATCCDSRRQQQGDRRMVVSNVAVLGAKHTPARCYFVVTTICTMKHKMRKGHVQTATDAAQ